MMAPFQWVQSGFAGFQVEAAWGNYTAEKWCSSNGGRQAQSKCRAGQEDALPQCTASELLLDQAPPLNVGFREHFES